MIVKRFIHKPYFLGRIKLLRVGRSLKVALIFYNYKSKTTTYFTLKLLKVWVFRLFLAAKGNGKKEKKIHSTISKVLLDAKANSYIGWAISAFDLGTCRGERINFCRLDIKPKNRIRRLIMRQSRMKNRRKMCKGASEFYTRDGEESWRARCRKFRFKKVYPKIDLWRMMQYTCTWWCVAWKLCI